MKITNPKDGSPIEVGNLSLKVGETKNFGDSDAEYLLRTFGFLKGPDADKAPKVLGGAPAAKAPKTPKAPKAPKAAKPDEK